MKCLYLWLVLLSWGIYAATLEEAALAQTIVPAGNTGTVVAPGNAQQVLIQGGTQAGGNLFHQFDRFGVQSGQTATFQARPTVSNIFGRVSGGAPSLINGTLEVTGANSNLYLINPAGIIFGRDARLNLPESFSATTADAIEFDQKNWLKNRDANQYSQLDGAVTGYAWLTPQPGAVVNAGSLRVAAGKSVTLAGGTVINTGTISAPGGQVTIAAVPGEKLVRVSQDSQVLSLDLPLDTSLVSDAELDQLPRPSVQRLPQLLAGGDVSEATGITVENGQVHLSAGKAAIDVQNGQAIVGGDISVVADGGISTQRIDVTGERIDLQEANLNASGINAGGQILVGGDFQGQGPLPRAQQVNVDAASKLQADAILAGDGGEIVVWSDDMTKFAGQASARGGAQSGNGGLVETSAKQQLKIAPTAKVSTDAPFGEKGTWWLDPTDLTVVPAGGGATIVAGTNSPTSASTIDSSTLEAALDGNNITLQATNSITVDAAVDSSGSPNPGDLQLDSPTLNLNERIQLNGNLSGTATTVNVGANGSIQNGVDAVANDGTVNLAAATYREGQTISINKSLTLQGQGVGNTTISGDGDNNGTGDYRGINTSGSSSEITIQQLTIADTVAVDTPVRDDGGGLRNQEATVQILDAEFRNNRTVDPQGDGGAIHNQTGAITITRTLFTQNQASQDGGVIDVERGTVTVTDSTFNQNQANREGGAIDVDPNGTFSVIGSSFSNNSAIRGGAIYSNGTASIDSTSFSNNQATDDGGAVHSTNPAVPLVIQGTTSFSNNQATNDGGALFVNGNTQFLQGDITGNTAGNNGGGIHNTGALTLNNATLNNNSAITHGGAIYNATANSSVTGTLFNISQNVTTAGDGGGLYNNQGTINLTNGSFISNQTGRDGGAIWIEGAGSLTTQGVVFRGNQANAGLGGGIFALSTSVNIQSSGFENNIAANDGGGIRLFGSDAIINNTQFTSNQAGFGGGLEASSSGTIQLSNISFLNNTATVHGGGIQSDGSILFTVDNSIFQNNQATLDGGAIHNNGQVPLRNFSVSNSGFDGNQGGRNGGAIQNSGNLIVTSTTLENNVATSNGGAIQNAGTATVTSGTLENNTANIDGGAIHNVGGILTVNSSQFTGNQATVGGGAIDGEFNSTTNIVDSSFTNNRAEIGGGLAVDNNSSATINNSDFLNNQATNNGGAINNVGNLTLIASTLQLNTASRDGGGIASSGSDLQIDASQIQNNTATQAGGGISLTGGAGTVSILSTTVSGNQSLGGSGAGLAHRGSQNLTIERSTFSANATTGNWNGGALDLFPSGGGTMIQIRNSTLSGNRGGNFGGALSQAGAAQTTLDSVTVADNTADRGGGLANPFGASLTLQNTVVARNSATLDDADIRGPITSLGNNLVQTRGTSTGYIGTDLADGTNPGLGTLGNYGGPTETIALLPGSPALNAGNSALTIDQRGINRVGSPDIGAFESRGFTLTTAGGGQTAEVNTAFAAPLQLTVGSAFGEPVNGGQVSFTAPTNGASAVLSSNPQLITITGGVAQVTLSANPVVGTYDVVATANGVAPAPFTLSNSAPVLPPPAPVPVPAPPPAPVPVPPVPSPPVVPPLPPTPPPPSEAVPSVIFTERAIDPNDLTQLDRSFTDEYRQQFGQNRVKSSAVTAEDVGNLLQEVERQRGIRSAVIYAMFVPEIFTPKQTETFDAAASSIPSLLRAVEKRDNDRLELVFITANGKLSRRSTPYSRKEVMEKLSYFWLSSSDVQNPESFQQFGAEFQQWLFAPIQSELATAKINNLVYVLDEGLRSIPVAVMQSPEASVLDRYTVSVIPSLGMLDRKIKTLENQTTLAMGASHFEQFIPLPAVPQELKMIQQQGFPGTTYLNEAFTIENTIQQVKQVRPGILHLATHATFNPGDVNQSAIQFWDKSLPIDQMSRLNLQDANLEMLILSACNTATGDMNAELGFTGMASLFGVRSAIGSLWSISDLGTFAFMSEFYGNLAKTPSRADALRQTQQAMRQGKVKIQQGQLITSNRAFNLPQSLQKTPDGAFDHPYYWSGFTLVGNPW